MLAIERLFLASVMLCGETVGRGASSRKSMGIVAKYSFSGQLLRDPICQSEGEKKRKGKKGKISAHWPYLTANQAAIYTKQPMNAALPRSFVPSINQSQQLVKSSPQLVAVPPNANHLPHTIMTSSGAILAARRREGTSMPVVNVRECRVVASSRRCAGRPLCGSNCCRSG